MYIGENPPNKQNDEMCFEINRSELWNWVLVTFMYIIS